MAESTENYYFYFFSSFLLIISSLICLGTWVPFLVLYYWVMSFTTPLLNVAGMYFRLYFFFIIDFIVFLIISFVMFILGAIQSYRKKIAIRSQLILKIEKKEKNKGYKFLGFAIFFAILIGLPALMGISILELMNLIIITWYKTMGILGIAIGVFLISIFGNFTIVFPVPYTFALITIGLSAQINIWEGILIAIMAGAGASIGELSAWLLGRSQAQTVEESEAADEFDKLRKQIDKGYGGLLVFIYAATPLPDDVLLIALGASKYNPGKLILWCFLGKVVLCALCIFGAGIIGEFISAESNPLTETLWMVIGIAVILMIIYVDWDKVFKRGKHASTSKIHNY